MITTFNDIINNFKNFTVSHSQINDFGWGKPESIQLKERITPMIWLHPIPGTLKGNISKLKFDMYVLSQLEQDYSNLGTIFNDTLIIGNDTVTNFWEDPDEIYGFTLNSDEIRVTPFEGDFDILTAGWIFNIELSMVTPSCSIPNN